MTATAQPVAHRQRALAAFYTEHQRLLAWRVRGRAGRVGDAIVEDACAGAWLALVRRPDIRLDRSGLAWLTAVAIHNAWRHATTGHEVPAGLLLAETDHRLELEPPAGPASDPLELALSGETHHDRVRRFATLKPRERRDLLLQAGGYRYQEVAQLTHSTYTAVNRRLTEGRKRLHTT